MGYVRHICHVFINFFLAHPIRLPNRQLNFKPLIDAVHFWPSRLFNSIIWFLSVFLLIVPALWPT